MSIVGGELMSSHLSVPPEATGLLAMFWGGNPIQSISAAAELLCWGEAATLVLVNLCVCVCVCVCV